MTASIRGFAICTAPRSGSNFLCQVLTSTDQLGRPLEYFNGRARRQLGMPGFPDDPQRQVLAIMDHGSTGNGVYGLKLFPTQLDVVSAALPRWRDALPSLQYVHLERRDLLGQALSWVRAEQTEQYRSTSPARRGPRYDAHATSRKLATIVTMQARWRLYFALMETTPLTLWHEDVVADPQGAAEHVAMHLGLRSPVRVDLGRIDLESQADGVSAAWRARFLSEQGDPSAAPTLMYGSAASPLLASLRSGLSRFVRGAQ